MKRTHHPMRKGLRNDEILRRALSGEKQAAIALDYDITPGRVQQIVQKERKWIDLTFSHPTY